MKTQNTKTQTINRIKNTIEVQGKRKVCRIFDYGMESNDRFTICFRGFRQGTWGMVYPYLSASDNPCSPLGVGQYGESRVFMTGRHLGKRVRFEGLPLEVQKFILSNI